MAGGRYDGLVEIMGGPPTPGVGWAAGIERVAMMLRRAAGGAASDRRHSGRRGAPSARGAEMTERLRRAGFAVDLGYSGNLGKRMKRAEQAQGRAPPSSSARTSWPRASATLRDLDSGAQEQVPLAQLAGSPRRLSALGRALMAVPAAPGWNLPASSSASAIAAAPRPAGTAVRRGGRARPICSPALRAAGFDQALVLSTCDRSELHAVAGDADARRPRCATSWRAARPASAAAGASTAQGYDLDGDAALRHLFAVAPRSTAWCRRAAGAGPGQGQPIALSQVAGTDRAGSWRRCCRPPMPPPSACAARPRSASGRFRWPPRRCRWRAACMAISTRCAATADRRRRDGRADGRAAAPGRPARLTVLHKSDAARRG